MTPVFTGDVLVVEDNFIIAMDVEELVSQLGATTVHLASTVSEALDLLDAHAMSAAILDFNLGEDTSEPVAARLDALGVRFVFATGYSDSSALPDRYRDKRLLKKPFTQEDVRAIFLDGNWDGDSPVTPVSS
ncbi:MAG: response regulator [Litorimonas sp.]